MNWTQTASGRAFEPLDPKPEAIDLGDIAHALSNQCRFAGHCLRFYSVAEHSVRVSTLAADLALKAGKSTPEVAAIALWGLLHDASEAYLVDLPAPLKRHHEFAFYRHAEAKLQAVICERYGLPVEMPDEVKAADLIMLATEKVEIMAPEPAPWFELPEPLAPGSYGPREFRSFGWPSDVAREKFAELATVLGAKS